MLASIGNRLVLSQSMPRPSQIVLWERPRAMNRLVPERSSLSALRPYAWLLALVLATIFLAWFGRDVPPPEHLCPDYIEFWATGKIVLSGQSPYDVDLQTRV